MIGSRDSACRLVNELISSRAMSRDAYLSPNYAISLNEFGRPVWLPRARGFLLERAIPGTTDRDATGLYPLFCCENWSAVPEDLVGLEDRVVSVVFVTDPFGAEEPSALDRGLSHGLVRYKDHHIIDLTVALDQSACAHHRRNARRRSRGWRSKRSPNRLNTSIRGAGFIPSSVCDTR